MFFGLRNFRCEISRAKEKIKLKMELFDNKDRTNIEELGEFGLINYLTKNIKITQPSTVKGVGDDAAVLNFEGKKNADLN